jgi:hypothetical protein
MIHPHCTDHNKSFSSHNPQCNVPTRGCTFDFLWLCITLTNLPNSHIRAVGLPCVQLPTASQVNLLHILFSILGEFFYKDVTPKIPNILICPLSYVEV